MFSSVQQFPGAIPTGGTAVTVAESVLMQTRQDLELPPASEGVVIRGYLNLTTAATGTGFTIRCRRLTLAGTQVGTAQQTTITAAIQTLSIPFAFTDLNPLDPESPADVYVITATAQVAAGTINDGQVEVMVPVPGGTDV